MTGNSRFLTRLGDVAATSIQANGEVFLGVNAAGKSLEQVTKPLTSVAGKAAERATTVTAATPARPATA